MKRAQNGVGNFMVDKMKTVSALCAVFCAIAIFVYPLDAVQHSCCPGAYQTPAQEIVNLVHTAAGARESSTSEEIVWTYSMTFPGPCMLNLTEHKQTWKKQPPDTPVTSIRETTQYLIPAADLEFGAFATHHTLERQGYMRLIMFTGRATIRRWHGDSPTPPEEAPVLFEAPINFGKPNVDIFAVPVRLQEALMHLASQCQL